MCGILAGMGIVSIIIINTQIAIGNGKLHYEPLPTSIDGCTNGTVIGDSIQNMTTNIEVVDDKFAFYRISFMVLTY